MPVDVLTPQMGESVVEATVSRWIKHEGDFVSPGEALVELETDKVNVEVAAEVAGTLMKILHAEGDTVAVGEALGQIEPGGKPDSSPAVPPTTELGAGKSIDTGSQTAAATPLAQALAKENSVDLSRISGSGPSGKITKNDVAGFIQRPVTEREQVPTHPPPAATSLPLATTVLGERAETRTRMSRRRQTIARRLVEAQHTAAMLTTFNEVDMTSIIEIRKKQRDGFKEKHGVGLGFMSFFTKAIVRALIEFPGLNSEIQGDEIITKHYYDIGMAVSTPDGLVVPVVRDADKLTFAQIESSIVELATRARQGKLTLPELQGGTFTITNGGIFGSMLSTPILNTPQVGILGMHKIQERAVVVDGQIVVRPMMYLALSYDHRIVDGAEAVRFLVRVKESLEEPIVLLLGV